MRSEFRKLKIKILLHVLLVISVALITGVIIQYVLIDGILQAPFADGFVNFCGKFLDFDYYQAVDLYDYLFRGRKTFLMMSGFLILLIISFYYTLSRLTKYFKEVSAGIDRLLDENTGHIKLSPEMDFMELKLNAVKATLLKRSKDASEAEQRKNELVVYLAHDIKTPLTSVIGYLNLLDEAVGMAEDQKAKYLKTTLDNALKLEELINEFFDITRFNLQTISLNPSEINLTYMLMQIADEFYPIFEAKGKKVIVKAEEKIIIKGDADKLARVFYNILKNAAAFSYDETDIVICAKYMDKNVKIMFTNQGETIPKEKLDIIFEKFYRLDESRSSRTGGAGLGLAIAKEIVTAHKGSIYAESNENETVFTVILPETISKS